MKSIDPVPNLSFSDEDTRMIMRWESRGDPYREGLSIQIESNPGGSYDRFESQAVWLIT